MSNTTSKFNDLFNVNELKDQVADAQENNTGGNGVEVPAGKYRVKIDKCELRACGDKAKIPGAPKCYIQFRITDGEYANQCLFYNKVLVAYVEDPDTRVKKLSALPTHYNNQFLKSLDVFDESEIFFEDYDVQYNDLLLDIAEECERSNLTFDIQYKIVNGFSEFKVLKTYEG